MKISEYGSRADKTRVETCRLLRDLCEQLKDVVDTIDNIEKTLWNEEYEDD